MDKTYSILINDNEYFVILKERRIKNFRLKFDNGIIFVSGYRITKQKADYIIKKNYQWLIKKIKIYNDKKNLLNLEDLINFKKIYLYGEIYDINFLESKNSYMINNKEYKFLKEINREKELKKIRLDNLDLLKLRVSYWCKVFNRLPSILYKDMKSKYGYCKYKDNLIVLSTRLVHLPIDVIDYIIVHEFCHFDVPNHSKSFYQAVSKYLYNYRLMIKRLKEYSLICK